MSALSLSSLAGGSHWYLEQDDLPVFGRMTFVDVPGETGRAVESGRAVFAGENLSGVQSEVAFLPTFAGQTLPAQVALGAGRQLVGGGLGAVS